MLPYRTTILGGMIDMRLLVDGEAYPIQSLDWRSDAQGTAIVARGFISKSEAEDKQRERLRQELIAFAKTGAPPALMAEGNVSDSAWVDNSPTYSAVAKSREARAKADAVEAQNTERCVPRLREQKPWVNPDEPTVSLDTIQRDNQALRVTPRFTYLRLKGRDEPHGCKRAGGFVDSNCMALCDCHETSRLQAKPRSDRPESLNAFAAECHRDNQHWWHDPATGARIERNMGEMLMLVVSEIAECMEGERKNLMDDHLPTRKMAEVELADAVIRLADIAGSKKCDLDAVDIDPADFASDNRGAQLLRISRSVQEIANRSYTGFAEQVMWAIRLIQMYADKHGYDLWGAVAEKREYNKHRADHKPEARLAANGKKF